MTPVLSPNTTAILLLTEPLIAGRGPVSADLLTPAEYRRLARHLREIKRKPADLLSPGAADILLSCRTVIDDSRLQRLLDRGFLLSQVNERWQSRAIWVVSRADASYPKRLKARMQEDAPAILYGCGDISLSDSGGLAVVGSRDVDDSLKDYAMAIGRLAARAGRTLVSGSAKGIDQAAMRGAIEGGGNACGVLPGDLESTAMNREHRNLIVDGHLVLVSAYDPSARFKGWQAMQRNKLIYALADASLVVESAIGSKSGTWAGAIEQLDKLKFVPVFVRSTGGPSAGLDALRKKGALPWPNPKDVESFEEVFNVNVPSAAGTPQSGLSLIDRSAEADTVTTHAVDHDATSLARIESNSSAPVAVAPDYQATAVTSKEAARVVSETAAQIDDATCPSKMEMTAAEVLFAAVRLVMEDLLKVPMKDSEVAAALNISGIQAKTWLQKLVDEGLLEKKNKPAGYVVKQKRLFE